MIALITVAAGRHDHLRLQREAVQASDVPPDLEVVVSMGDPEIARICGAGITVLDVGTTGSGLPVAAARNAGAQAAMAAGADVMIFLDVDCIPSSAMIGRYGEVARYLFPDALLSGSVAYLPPPPPGGYQTDRLAQMATPHADRPDPPADGFLPLRHELFWSLSFALTPRIWNRIGGFCERYTGYGGEDTDFAESARSRGVQHIAVGGATAFHQWHPSPDPPLNHFDDIIRNARIFHERWGWWPMHGWLDAFGELGLIRYDTHDEDWIVTARGGTGRSPGQPDEIARTATSDPAATTLRDRS